MSVPAARRAAPRPNVRCRRPEPGQVDVAPGTVVWAGDGRVLVYVGDAPGLVDVAVLAPRLRRARSVDLVGDMHRVARPAKFAILAAWTAATRAARTKPAAVPRPRPERCGRPRKDGQPCRSWAGAGPTDTPGVGPCVRHGGATVERDAERQRQAERALTVARLHAKASTAPLTPEEQLQGLGALRDLLAAQQGNRKARRAYRSVPP